jgi:hypothetical protein
MIEQSQRGAGKRSEAREGFGVFSWSPFVVGGIVATWLPHGCDACLLEPIRNGRN